MRVVLIGNLEPDHSTENDWRRALLHLGHQVMTVQENRVESIAWLETSIREYGPAFVMYVRTWGLPGEATAMWRRLEDAGIPSVSAHLDLYYGLASPKDNTVQRYAMPSVDPQFKTTFCFTADGGHDAEFARDGVNHHWLPPAVRHDEARRIEPDEETQRTFAGIDVAFVGSKGYHPEWPHRPEMVDRLRARYRSRFVHVGNGGDVPTTRGEKLNMLYTQVPVIVGDYCFAGTARRYWSDRFPEVWGRGGYLVFPANPDLEEFCGMSYPSWEVGDWDGLFAIVDDSLGAVEMRGAICQTWQAHVAAHDTYVNRVQTMLDTMGLA